MLRLDGRVAIVTGAGGGVGRAHALALAERGAQVVVNDLGIALDGSAASSEPAQHVVEEIAQAGGHATADAHSVAEPDQARAIVQTALDAYGRVDILVNNAGVLDDQLLAGVDDAYVDRVLDTHLRGAVTLCRAVWAPMAERGHGRIVNTSSGAVFGSPGGTVYQTAKAGLLGLDAELGARRLRPRHPGQRDHANGLHTDDRHRPRPDISRVHGADLRSRARRVVRGRPRFG